MEKIGNITILTKTEIVKKAKDVYSLRMTNKSLTKWDKKSLKENLKKCVSESLPYSLFRYNELTDFTLNGVGCVISDEMMSERLEVLPPLRFKKDIFEGFIVNEPITHTKTGVSYEHIFNFNKKNFCVIMENTFKVI